MAKLNVDEVLVCEIANKLPGATARLATPQEDHGFRKADVVLDLEEKLYFIQVSHMPKSVGEKLRLTKRGTYPVHTHKYENMPLLEKEIYKMLEEITGSNS